MNKKDRISIEQKPYIRGGGNKWVLHNYKNKIHLFFRLRDIKDFLQNEGLNFKLKRVIVTNYAGIENINIKCYEVV